MKIAILHYEFQSERGAERTMYEVAKGLKEKGHVVAVFTLSASGRYYNRFDVLNIPLYYLLTRKLSLLEKEPPRLHHVKLAKQVNAWEPDVVLSSHSSTIWCLPFIKAPVVHYAHENGSRYTTEPYFRSLSRHWLASCWSPFRRALDKYIVKRHVTTLVQNSNYSAERGYLEYGVFSEVVYPGFNPDVFHPYDVPRGDYIVSVGTCHPYKGFQDIVMALSKLENAPRFVLVSKCDNHDWFGRTLYSLGIRNGVRIIWKENLSDKALAELYSGALCYVQTAVMEPFGLTAIEAQACGCPVVAYNEAGARENVIYGTLTTRHNLSRAIKDTIHYTQGKCVCKENMYERMIAQFNWKNSIEKLDTVIRSAVEE